MLDDAAGHQQVRPLLPGTPGSMVLITSRRRLAALEDTALVTLDTLTPDEATDLLARLAGRADVTADDPEVARIAALCGYLPLAIGMLARQLAHHPAWTPTGLAADLAAARDRLELMAAENLSVAAAFGLSYEDLDNGQRRLSAGWACTRAPTSTHMLPRRWMAAAWTPPAGTWKASTTST